MSANDFEALDDDYAEMQRKRKGVLETLSDESSEDSDDSYMTSKERKERKKRRAKMKKEKWKERKSRKLLEKHQQEAFREQELLRRKEEKQKVSKMWKSEGREVKSEDGAALGMIRQMQNAEESADIEKQVDDTATSRKGRVSK